MKYLVDDQIFNTEQEALEYEKQKKLEEIDRLKKEEEKDKRRQEVLDAYNKYDELRIAYFRDYPDTSNYWQTFFERMFG